MTGISRGRAAEIVAEMIQRRISPVGGSPYYTIVVKDNRGRDWKVMRDSSINPQPAQDEYRLELLPLL